MAVSLPHLFPWHPAAFACLLLPCSAPEQEELWRESKAPSAQISEEVIAEWNIRNSNQHKLMLEAVLWEKHAASENRGKGEWPQEPITRQIVDDCDYAIGIFWSRIGTPTKLAEGGAFEEVQRMLNVLERNQKGVAFSGLSAL